MNVRIDPQWGVALADEFNAPYFKDLTDRVRSEYSTPAVRVYPLLLHRFSRLSMPRLSMRLKL